MKFINSLIFRMNKLVSIILILFIGLFITQKAYASVADVSDTRVQDEVLKVEDHMKKVKALSEFLKKYNSELMPYSEDLVSEAEKNNIPWHLVVSISGVESTLCKRIPYNSYNCWGWANGATHFKDYKEAISVVSKTLGENYFKKGLDTPEKISPVYAPPSHTWAGKVRWFMAQIESASHTSSQ